MTIKEGNLIKTWRG